MSNIDTRTVATWGDAPPTRSSLTAVANQLEQIRRWHNAEFRRLYSTPGGSLHAVRLRHEEDLAISSALRRHGWTYGSLEAELTSRTTKRWARRVIQGWF